MTKRSLDAALVSQRSNVIFNGLSHVAKALIGMGITIGLSQTVLANTKPEGLGPKQEEKPRECQTLRVNLKDGLEQVDPKLAKVFQTLKKGLIESDSKALRPLFHPRLKISLSSIEEVMARQKNLLKAPFDVSLFRAWQIQNPDGSAAPLSCDNGDIQIAPHYGYENQMAIWLQMLGQSEIGRVYVGLVPHEEQWYVGSFHYHQWTHKGDNFELWFQRAQADMTQELYPAAYVKLDMAAKLVGGSKFFELPIKDEIERLQQSVIEKKMWEESIKTSLKDQKPIVHMGSIFASEGAGLLIHFEIEKEMTTQEIKDDCSKVTAALNQHKWFQSIAGVKCNYVFRGADPTREGPMGGIFMTSSPVSAPKK